VTPVRARSASRSALALLHGPRQAGRHLGAGYVQFGDYVLALTRPGGPRMPNGIECDVRLPPRDAGAWIGEGRLGAGIGEGRLQARIGEGRLEIGGQVVLPGPLWEARPTPRVALAACPRFVPDPLRLAGAGEGLTPAGDDLLAGYAAGLVLWHGREEEARAIADAAAPRTTLLSATLLRHAARGELPEPAHTLLETGDAAPLRAFGHSSGRALMAGLALAC